MVSVRGEGALPWAVGHRHLGEEVLEVGPGPGLTTDVLRRRVRRLTAVEIDERLAAELAARLDGKNVDVVLADGTQLPFEAGRFSSATLFTMLHHVPSVTLQDSLLAELRRVLRSGGLLVGTDSIETPSRRELHAGDVYQPIDPAGLENRLAVAGFVEATVEVAEDRFLFLATAPGGGAPGPVRVRPDR